MWKTKFVWLLVSHLIWIPLTFLYEGKIVSVSGLDSLYLIIHRSGREQWWILVKPQSSEVNIYTIHLQFSKLSLQHAWLFSHVLCFFPILKTIIDVHICVRLCMSYVYVLNKRIQDLVESNNWKCCLIRAISGTGSLWCSKILSGHDGTRTCPFLNTNGLQFLTICR